MAKKKLKKAILVGLTAYAASKMMGPGKADWRKNLKHTYGKSPIKQVGGDASIAEGVHGAKHLRKPAVLEGEDTRGRPLSLWEKIVHGGTFKKGWFKKHGGAIKAQHAKVGKMIKAAQGTYAREDESIGMRLGAKKTKHDKKVARDESYGDWGKRKHDWAKKGKMVKARYGTEVRTDGSNPHVPAGGTAYVRTKLNGTLKTKTY